jgi:hypothetical protein
MNLAEISAIFVEKGYHILEQLKAETLRIA